MEEPPGLVINEVLAWNDSTQADASGAYDDWIELYNAGDADISLAGYALTPSPDSTDDEYGLPGDITLAAGDHLLVWCDTPLFDTGAAPGDEVHVPFPLNKEGGGLSLVYRLDGPSLVDTLAWGPQMADVAAARVPDGAEGWTYATPTPGAPNGDAR